jgi:hypothetical protein
MEPPQAADVPRDLGLTDRRDVAEFVLGHISPVIEELPVEV